jgi:hypothetical protein
MEEGNLESVWDSVVRAFVGRRPGNAGGVRSEPLVAQGGAWILQSEGFLEDSRFPMPFAAILDALPTVAIVPSLNGWDTPARDLREIAGWHANQAGLRVEMNNRVLTDLGAWSRDPDAQTWYATLRGRWRPEQVKTLLIVDRVPDPRGPRHHFYAEPITGGDHLFRAVVEALYMETPGRPGDAKEEWLARLRGDGVYVIDLVTQPIARRDEFAAALDVYTPQCVEQAHQLRPDGVILCGKPTFQLLIDKGLPVLHNMPIPFPASRWRAEFISDLRRALQIIPDPCARPAERTHKSHFPGVCQPFCP